MACSPSFSSFLLGASRGGLIKLVHCPPRLENCPTKDIVTKTGAEGNVPLKALKFAASGKRAIAVDWQWNITIMDFAFE